MRLKNFTARTLPEAMGLVRQQMGADAAILSIQPCGRGGGVRVTAALEGPTDDDHEPRTSHGHGSHLEAIDVVCQALDHHAVPHRLAERLLAAAGTLPAEDGVAALAGALDAELTFAALPGISPTRPLMLVGPPGGGKSATAAKLCALARVGGYGATLVTMDVVKCGALEQASAYAKALSVRLVQAADPQVLPEAIRRCPADHFVVIDTVGINPFCNEEMAQLVGKADTIAADKFLVLPGGGDALDSAETAIAFAEAGARFLIASKVDVVRRLGGIVAAMHASGLALTALGISPAIGGGLCSVNPVSFARLLCEGLPVSSTRRP